MLSTHLAGEVVQITWYNGTRNVTRQIRLAAPPTTGQTTGTTTVTTPASLPGQPA